MKFDPMALHEGDGSTLYSPDGTFWADHIKTLRDRPVERLAFAEKYQPLPAAFREAAIALRALIRSRIKGDEPVDELLVRLYRTAATDAFLYSEPQILGKWPAHNAVAHLEEEEWRGLEFPYQIVGHVHLRLLNKTDRKWIEDAWGAPGGHANPQDLYREVFERGVRRFQQESEQRDRELRELLRRPVAEPTAKSGCAGAAVLFLTGAAAMALAVAVT